MLDGIDMTDDDHTSRDSSARSPRTGKSRWPFLFSAKTAVVPFTAQARAKRQRKEKDPNREMLALLFFQVLFFFDREYIFRITAFFSLANSIIRYT